MAALTAHHPDWFSRDGNAVRNHLTGETFDIGAIDPLELAGRLVQEDLCLIETISEGPIFTAAVLCFPSRWRLWTKSANPSPPCMPPCRSTPIGSPRRWTGSCGT